MLIIFLKSFIGFLQSGDFFDFCFIGTVSIQILFQYAIAIYLFIENVIEYFKKLTKCQAENVIQTCSNVNDDSNIHESKS